MFHSYYKKIFTFFDRTEDKVRGRLSKYPIIYAIVAGVSVVLFWRGVWHTTDILESRGGILGFIFSGPLSLILSTLLLLLTGVFVSEFVGEMLILTGLKKEKKIFDKTEDEIKKESQEIELVEAVIYDLSVEINHIQTKQKEIENKIDQQTDLLKKLLQ